MFGSGKCPPYRKARSDENHRDQKKGPPHVLLREEHIRHHECQQRNADWGSIGGLDPLDPFVVFGMKFALPVDGSSREEHGISQRHKNHHLCQEMGQGLAAPLGSDGLQQKLSHIRKGRMRCGNKQSGPYESKKYHCAGHARIDSGRVLPPVHHQQIAKECRYDSRFRQCRPRGQSLDSPGSHSNTPMPESLLAVGSGR